MKNQRQAKILEIIAERDIETQEELLTALQACGFNSTQATISRDIKELRIVKELDARGAYRYSAARTDTGATFSAKLNTIFRECVTGFDSAQNMVVITTLPGMAQAACSALDSMKLPQIVGTLGGDDTAFLVMRDTAAAQELCNEIRRLLQ